MLVPIPGYPGMYADSAMVAAWTVAGRPRLNGSHAAWRSYQMQLDMWKRYKAGGSPADNPDSAAFRRPHMRGLAMDLSGYDTNRCLQAGLHRPVKSELWHWELKTNIYNYPIVPSVPVVGSPAGTETGTIGDWFDMATRQDLKEVIDDYFQSVGRGPGGRTMWQTQQFQADLIAGVDSKVTGLPKPLTAQESKDAFLGALTDWRVFDGGRNLFDQLKFIADAKGGDLNAAVAAITSAIAAAEGRVRADINYIHTESPDSLKAIRAALPKA